jgi:hypothetical protein
MIVAMSTDPHSLVVAHSASARKRAAAAALLALGIGTVGLVRAIDRVQFEVAQVEGEGWVLENIAIDAEFGEATNAQVSIARAHLSSAGYTLRNIRISCASIELGKTLVCNDGTATLELPTGRQQWRGRVAYDRATQRVEFDMRAPSFAGGNVRVRGQFANGGWRLGSTLDNVALEQVLGLASELKVSLPDVAGAGRIVATIEAAGTEALQRLEIDARLAELTANNADGTLASDTLALSARATIARDGEEWRFDVALNAPSGQAYIEPVFLDFGQHALDLRAEGSWLGSGEIVVRSFAIDHVDAVRANGSARLILSDEPQVRDARVNVQALQFPGAYVNYLQPFLLGGAFASLTMSGRAAGMLHIEHNTPRRFALELDAIDIDDGTRKLVVHGLSGAVAWHDTADDAQPSSERSLLRWRGGSLLNLAFGEAELLFAASGRSFRLLAPAQIPVLDGRIDLDRLWIGDFGQPTMAIDVDANLQPISVTELCRAFGWPEFGGTLGGSISQLRMRDGVVTLGTTLEGRVFDGRIAIRDLRLEDALGAWPRFSSSIAFDNLDLELVTQAFAFGRITGRLSGEIAGLQLFNWRPIAFDARFYTPPNDRSKRRISQRAVENIGSIGGGRAGVAQALSSGLLRFFEEFRYDRLGLSCRLENDVCYIDGIAPAPDGGYYLVKGAGLPRIDVIGSAHRVDWPRLVRQLVEATKSGGPTVGPAPNSP